MTCIAIAAISVGVSFALNAIEMKRTREFMDELYKNNAICKLSELEGRVEEIQYLNWSIAARTPEMQEELREDLDEIMDFESSNKYLEDFKISVELGEAASIDSICEQILSQIRGKIYDIT